MNDLALQDLEYVDIEYGAYVYIVPSKIKNTSAAVTRMRKLLDQHGYAKNFKYLDKKFYPQENRYVKLLTNVNPVTSQQIKVLKLQYAQDRSIEKVPLFHGLGLEPYVTRYYPYQMFLSHVLGFVDNNGAPFYGVEQYFDELLAGKDGEINGRASAWIGQVGANDFEIKNVENGDNIYLTVDMSMQREIEAIAKSYQESLRADSVAILVYDPFSGQVKASTSYPSFNPNDYDAVYQKMPLSPKQAYLIDDDTYVDVPVYMYTGGDYILARTYDRNNTGLQKYISQNIFGPQVFVDKNISMAYEPGSIFKAFTVGVGLDSDEIRLYDYYNDP